MDSTQQQTSKGLTVHFSNRPLPQTFEANQYRIEKIIFLSLAKCEFWTESEEGVANGSENLFRMKWVWLMALQTIETKEYRELLINNNN